MRSTIQVKLSSTSVSNRNPPSTSRSRIRAACCAASAVRGSPGGVQLVSAQHGREERAAGDRRGERSSGPAAGRRSRPRTGRVFLHVRAHGLRCDDEGVAAGSALDGIAQGVAEFGRGQNGDPVDEVGQVVDVVVKRGCLDPRRSASSPMLSCANPISSASMAPASVTEAGASPALGMRQHLGQEWQGQREQLIGRLGVRVVTDTLQDNQLTRPSAGR